MQVDVLGRSACGECGQQHASFDHEVIAVVGDRNACQQRFEHIQSLQILNVGTGFPCELADGDGRIPPREYRAAGSGSQEHLQSVLHRGAGRREFLRECEQLPWAIAVATQPALQRADREVASPHVSKPK